MNFEPLTPAWRARLSRLVLVMTVCATIATSDSDWRVSDQDSVRLPLTIPAGGLVVGAEVRYQAPRGVWPLRVSMRTDPWATSLTIKRDVVFDELEVQVSPDDPDLFEVRCREKQCEGILSLDLLIAPSGTDGGLTRSLESGAFTLSVDAGVNGEPTNGFFGCQRPESSTDRQSPPSRLLVDVMIDALDPALYEDAGVPDAGALGSAPLPPLRGMDGGLR